MGRITFAGTCLLMVFNSSAALAQTEAGSKLIGADFGGASYSNARFNAASSFGSIIVDDEVTTTSYSFFVNPSVGWFVKDNLALGGLIGLSYFHNKAEVSGATSVATSPNVQVGPFVRYYLGDGEHGKPFLDASVSYVFAPTRRETNASSGYSSETRVHPKGSYSASLGVGYEHFINKSVGFAMASGIDYFYEKDELTFTATGVFPAKFIETNKQWTVPLSIALQFHLP